MLAHVNAPFALTQLRSFDVPLMVFVSGLCFKLPQDFRYSNYVIKRLKRLYIPTFIFLVIYFLLILLARFAGAFIPYNKLQILGTFLLFETPSIGYVWIIRVFILMALICPIVFKIVRRTGSILFYCSLILIYLSINFIVPALESSRSIFIKYLFIELGIYTLAYSLFLGLAFKIKLLNSKGLRICGVISLIILILFGSSMFIKGSVFPISAEYKYPPHSIYLLYGAICSIFAFWATMDLKLPKIICKIICFISEHSLWVYLWHIPFVVLANSIDAFAPFWYAKWVICYCLAIATTSAQTILLNYIETHSHKRAWFKYLLK